MGGSWQGQHWFPEGSGHMEGEVNGGHSREEIAMPRPEGATQQSMFRVQQSAQSESIAEGAGRGV